MKISIFPDENHLRAKWSEEQLGLKLTFEQQLLPSLDDSYGFYVAIFRKA